MISIRGLRHGVLDIAECEIPAGHTVVTGPNGSGKTTLLRLLAGMEEPFRGCVRVEGKTPGEMPIGWVHEFPSRNALFLSVYEELASPLRFRHMPCDEISRKVSRMAEKVGISHLLDRDLVTLSGGEQVLTALATALIPEPAVLILDEWDSHLDAGTTAMLHDLLKDLCIRCLVQCTLDMDLAATADWVVFLSRGRIRAAGPPEEVFERCAGSCWYPPGWRWREWSSLLKT